VDKEPESKKFEFVNLDEHPESTIQNMVQEDGALTNSQKGKQIVEVELDEQHSLTEKGDDNESSRNSQHREEPYSLEGDWEKHDRKAPEKCDFVDMVSFALAASSGDPSSVQDGMPKEMELLQKGKAWELVGLLRERRQCRQVDW
jgi:hypothetical protein